MRVPQIQGNDNVLVPMIDRVIVNEGRLDLDGAEEGMGVFRPVVDVAYQMGFLRSNIAGDSVSSGLGGRKNWKGEGSERGKNKKDGGWRWCRGWVVVRRGFR